MKSAHVPYKTSYGMLHACMLLLCSLALTACRPDSPTAAANEDRAALLRIEERDSFIRVEVLDAWHTGQTLRTYLLVPREKALPSRLPAGQIVRTPLQRAVCFSSVHAALLYELGCPSQIAGLADVPYVQQQEIRRDIAEGKLSDVGSSIRPETERIAGLHPDAMLVSSIENDGHGQLQQLGIPVIECADYMEHSALGRAEWMRFFGLLFGRGEQADSLFRAVSSRYDSLRSLPLNTANRPTLLCDVKQGGTWYVPGGKSYLGRIYADAGANYLFADQEVSGSAALSPEAVFARGRQADVWLVKYGAAQDLTYEQMAADDPIYRQFDAWRQRHIYGCNTYKSAFYEEVPFHPDLLLRDLIHIFHPELLPGYRPRYFTPLHSRPAVRPAAPKPVL